jgi:glycosyltransferase involved in cell wall biosynthesis
LLVEKQLRICIVAFLYAPIVGGAESRAAKQASQLQELGHKVTVVTLRHDKRWAKTEIIDGVSVIRVEGIYNRKGRLRIGRLGHLPTDLCMFLQLWRMRHQYDLLHSIQLSPLAAVAALIGNLTGKPVVVSIPSTGPAKMPRPEDATLMLDTLTDKSINPDTLKIPYEDIVVGDLTYLKRTAIGADLILRYLKQSSAFYQILSSRSYEVMTKHGFKAEQIIYIPNGIDTEKFKPDPALRPDPTRPERDILCVARLQYPKGIDILLHAWKRMMTAPTAWRLHLQPRLLIAGTGQQEEQLKYLAKVLEIEDSVIFLGNRSDVTNLLHKAWGFILPSRWEGMPNALLEAMSCGVPSIATRVSGSEDIVVNNVNGLLIEPEQPLAMAQALKDLITDTELATHLASEGRATVIQKYQLRHITEECIKLYQKALHQEITLFPPKVLESIGE